MQAPFICDELEDSVPLNEQDKSWIRETIQNAHQRHGWGRLTRFVKEWSGVGGVIAIGLFLFVQWTAYVEFRTTTNSDISGIKGKLTSIEGQLAKQSFVNQSSLPLPEFKATLPDLAKNVAILRDQKSDLPPNIVNSLTQKMTATDPEAQGYWPAAAQLISYRSSLSQNWRVEVIKPCLPKAPNWGIAGFVFQDCVLDLDGIALKNDRCVRCVVKYSGGSVSIENLHLIDCLLVFTARPDKSPDQNGQKLEQTLLASDLSDITIPAIS